MGKASLHVWPFRNSHLVGFHHRKKESNSHEPGDQLSSESADRRLYRQLVSNLRTGDLLHNCVEADKY